MINKLQKPINFDNWTCRASASGKLNTNPAGKTPLEKYEDAVKEISDLKLKEKLTTAQSKKLQDLNNEISTLESKKNDIVLSQTAKTYLKECYWSLRTDVKRDIHSKYIENGTLGEKSGISLISKLDDPDLFEMGSELYEKCTLPRQKNNHFEGECDIKFSPTIQDIKCSWDIFTFYPHLDELLFNKDGSTKWIWNEDNKVWELPADNIENDDYRCQGVVYLELYGESEFRLRYCLVNMPEELLNQQLKWILRDFGGVESDSYQESAQEFIKMHKFDHLPIELRVCTFRVLRDVDLYQSLCRKVEKAREYLNWYSTEMFYIENPGLKPEFKLMIGSEVVDVKPFNIKIETGFGFVEKNDEVIESVVLPKSESEEMIAAVSEIKKLSDKDFEKTKTNIIENIGKILNKEELDLYFNSLDETLEILPVDLLQKVQNEFSNKYKHLIAIKISEDKKVEPTKSEEVSKSEPAKQEQPKTEQSGIDNFLVQIIELKTIEDAVAFYMENADKIDDTKYEEIYFKKKDELSSPKEDAPKLQKAKPPIKAEKVDVEKDAEVVYSGNERYNISDGYQNLKEGLSFEESKSFIIAYLKEKFLTWLDFKSHRDGITAFYNANKTLIDRDKSFKEIVSNMSKSECNILIEKQRKITMDLVNKM